MTKTAPELANLFEKDENGQSVVGKALANMHDGPKDVSLRNAVEADEQLVDIDEAPKGKVDPTKLAAIIDKARELFKADKRVEEADKELKAAKADLKQIATNELPKLMKDAGMTNCPLNDGWSVELDTLVTASVPAPDAPRAVNAKERHEKGIAYLDKVAPDLVSHVATITFAKGNEKQLQKLLTNVGKYKPPMEISVKASVHSGTLGKWVRLQDAAGKAVDEAALGVSRIPTAELIEPKKAKDKV